MKKYFIVISILIVIFISACKNQETKNANERRADNLLLYENKNLGVSFNYPSSFTIADKLEGAILILSDYDNSNNPGVSVGMKIIKAQKPSTEEQIRSLYEGIAKEVGLPVNFKKQNKENYELIEIEFQGFSYYILSEKGTFIIDDDTDKFKGLLEQQGLYKKYKDQFKGISDSIKII